MLAGLLGGLIACGDDASTSPEQRVRVADVSSPIVEADGSVWVLVGDVAIEFDAATHERRSEIDLGGGGSNAIEVEDGVVWVMGMFGVARLDTATGSVASNDRAYRSLATVGGRLFGFSDGDLYEIDPVTAEDLGQVALPLNSNGSEYEVVGVPLITVGNTVWVTVADSDFSFSAFDPQTREFATTVRLDESYESAVLVGDVIWLADRYGEYVVVDAATGERLDVAVELPVGETILDAAGSLFVGPDDSLWLLDQPSQDVYQLDPQTGAVLGSFHLQLRPTAMAITATELWLTNSYDDSITVLPRSALRPA